MSNYLRNVVCCCPACDYETDVVCREDDRIRCLQCETVMEQHWWKRSRQVAQWDERDAVVVFRSQDGRISYPARNDKPTPPGMDRVTMRSLAEVRSFERQHNVRNEAMDFDRGSGRGHDEGEPARCQSPRRDTFSEVF